MKLFINDISVSFIKGKDLTDLHVFSGIINPEEEINPKLLIDNILFMNPDNRVIDQLLELMNKELLPRLTMITMACESREKIIDYLKSKFTIIEAAGGIVEGNGKYLMIYRNGLWGIPKGKMEKNESTKECASREVEEETCVKVSVDQKIGSIWHTYMNKKKPILKKTHWYTMICLDDSKMKPQEEESITLVEWKSMQEMQEALVGSYRSLRYLVLKYRQKFDRS